MPRHNACPTVPVAKDTGQRDISLHSRLFLPIPGALGLQQAMFSLHFVCSNACPAGLIPHEVRHEEAQNKRP